MHKLKKKDILELKDEDKKKEVKDIVSKEIGINARVINIGD